MIEASADHFAQSIYSTLCAVSSAETLEALNDVVAPAACQIGFSHFSAVQVLSAPQSPGLTFLFGRPDLAWRQAYRSEGLAEIDPRVRHILGSSEPALLSEIAFGRGRRDLEFMRRLGEFGHSDCFIWPVHLPEGLARAVLMMAGPEPVDRSLRVAAGALASAFHAAGARLLRQDAAAAATGAVLRPRQVECLYWACQGKSSADTGRIVGISARTVDEHIANACEILGVRSRIQAVAHAVALGLL